MKSAFVVIVLLFVMLLAGNTNAFDCQRKGFVIGVGAGVAPIVKGSWGGDPGEEYNEVSMASNFLTGYAWNESNMILFIVDYASLDYTLPIYRYGIQVYEDEFEAGQAFTGFAFSHYFAPVGHSPFVTLGIGIQGWIPDQKIGECHTGLGFLVGGGYEFTRHMQIYGSLAYGRTSDDDDHKYDHTQLMLTLTGVLY